VIRALQSNLNHPPVIGQVAVRDVDKLMVLKIIKPMWNEKTETADRVRDRIKLVLNWAKAHGLREGDNPADWRGHLEHVLAPRHKVAKLTHQPAVPVAEMAAFLSSPIETLNMPMPTPS
jgi:hypothetical protein